MLNVRSIDTLALRFSVYLIILSMTMAVVATVVETYVQYSSSMLGLKQRLESIKQSHDKSLTTALWFFDEDQLKQQMSGILRDPDIIFVEVKSPSITISIGNIGNKEQLLARTYELIFIDEVTEQREKMGELYFIVRLDQIIADLFAKAWYTLLLESGKALLLSGFIFMIFRLLITRHLGVMAWYTRSLSLENLSSELSLKRMPVFEGNQDELALVVSAVNEMRLTLLSEIEENRKAEEALSSQKDLLNNVLLNIPSSIYWKNKRLEYQGCNDNFLKDANLERREDLLGCNEYVLPWLPDEKELFYERDKSILESGDSILLHEDAIHADGTNKLTILSSTVPMLNAEKQIEGVLGIYTDVTEIKKAEQQLHELNDDLEEMIERRTEQLQIANNDSKQALSKLTSAQDKLVEAEKMAAIGSLVAGVAHEINTPLGISVTAASHMQNQAKNLRDLFDDGKMTKKDFTRFFDTCNESIEILLKNLHRSQDLILSFKQVANDQSTDEVRTFLLKEYIEEIILSLKPKLKKTQHQLTVECDATIEMTTIPGALSHVLTNLIMNSLVHAFEYKEVGKIEIVVKPVDEETLTILYSDNGKGIPEEHLKTIYEPFFTTKRGSGGSGLGLHILYTKATQSLKGQVKCSSEVGLGTAFEFTLPTNIAHKN